MTNELNSSELQRYSRHIILPRFGIEAQKKLKAASVLVVGAGGLGSSLLQYLVAAGIGRIGIVEFDKVEESNLQRQVLYTTQHIGEFKADAALKHLSLQNPHVQFQIFKERLDSQNALKIIEKYDVVADGTDNFATRYLVNDACLILNKPNVYASIFQFEGQLSVFNYVDAKGKRGPNYRDLFPEPPPPDLVPSCAEGGVIGVLPGIMGSLQANEVIKILSGCGEPLSGYLLLFDALDCSFKRLRVKHSENTPTIKALIDYDQFCSGSQTQIKQIGVETFFEMQQKGELYQLIDVREKNEYELDNLNGELLPLGELRNLVHRINRKGKVIVHCKSGMRSEKAIRLLESEFGFDNLINLQGGITAWLNKYSK